MRKTGGFLAAAIFSMALASITGAAADIPNWAFPVNPPSAATVADDGREKHVPNSTRAFTRETITAISVQPPDWHPDEHPPMPGVVGRSREPKIYACAYCHLPNGAGRPENASLAGLSRAYIRQQIVAFRNGDRPGSASGRIPQTLMIAVAKSVTDDEIESAATYFASLKPASFVKVVEAAEVPKSVVSGWMLATVPGGGTEPIGNRIIEIAEDLECFENRDSRSAYVAYVPPGSVRRGEELVSSGGAGRTLQCVTCHGPGQKGLGDVPRLAGRSPGYLMRQLYDLKHGARKGGTTELMKPVVANLAEEDMVAIAAYLGGRAP